MKNIKLNKNMKRAIKKKGYSIKYLQNGIIIEYENEFIQILEGDECILIFWKENVKCCDCVNGIWPDRKKIRLKVEEEKYLYNLNIKVIEEQVKRA